jgi:hypothetical protein
MLKGAALGPLIDKARQHVVGYYKKKAKRRKNPDITIPMGMDETMLPANDVAELLGGEFIPLKGMIVGDNEIQLITEPGVTISNPGKAKIRNSLFGLTKKTVKRNPARKIARKRKR